MPGYSQLMPEVSSPCSGSCHHHSRRGLGMRTRREGQWMVEVAMGFVLWQRHMGHTIIFELWM